MPVIDTHISWTDTTWNPATGCTKVSPGCENCYAEALTGRRLWGNADFSTVKIHPDRLRAPRRWRPVTENGTTRPRLVFVNSMSDLHHDQIPDSFRDQVYDEMEMANTVVFQVLTKRAALMSQYLKRRYGNRSMPANIWVGTSVENSDPAVAARINILRKMRDRIGNATLFLSVEPLIGPVDAHDYTGIDQVLIGGESMQRGKRRPCKLDWVAHSIDKARRAGAAVHFKQWGHASDNPYAQAVMDKSRAPMSWKQAFDIACTIGHELAPEEKGGATFRGELIRERPPIYSSIPLQNNPYVAA